jgi:hypothetical protein
VASSAKASSLPAEGRPTVPLVPRLPWQVFLSEMIGTGLLLFGGLSLVILAFGDGSPIAALVPSVKVRQMLRWSAPLAPAGT